MSERIYILLGDVDYSDYRVFWAGNDSPGWQERCGAVALETVGEVDAMRMEEWVDGKVVDAASIFQQICHGEADSIPGIEKFLPALAAKRVKDGKLTDLATRTIQTAWGMSFTFMGTPDQATLWCHDPTREQPLYKYGSWIPTWAGLELLLAAELPILEERSRKKTTH